MYVLQILDEEIFEIAVPSFVVCLDVRIRGGTLVHERFDEISLSLVHRNDADRAIGALSHHASRLFDDRTCFLEVPALSDFVCAVDLAA